MKRSIACAVIALGILALGVTPAHAVEPPHAVLNGKALAVAAQNLLYVNPNFDVYPVYSFSRNDNLSSYDLSGGVWPGFLLDAFMDFYGFGKPERSALGIVETQYPGFPSRAHGGTSDYGRDNLNNACGFLFGPAGPAANPEALAACKVYVQTMIDDKSSKQLSASGISEYLQSSGKATLDHAVLAPGVVADHVESVSATNALKGVQESSATLLIQGLTIGPLRIGTLRAEAAATAGKAGRDASSDLILADVTFDGRPAEITDQGVHMLLDSDLRPVNDQLAAFGFDVRLTQGREYDDGPSRAADSGGLVVRMRRDSLPAELVAANDTMCRTFSGPPFSDVPELHRIKEEFDNPLYGVVPFVPMPPSIAVDEPVPPVVPCLYPNVGYDIGILLGTAHASAQFTPLPPPPAPDPDPGPSIPPPRVVFDTIAIPGGPAFIPPVAPAEERPSIQVRKRYRAIPVLTAAVSSRIKLVYAVMWILLVLIVAGRFALRALAAP